jgi:hypothetical protein
MLRVSTSGPFSSLFCQGWLADYDYVLFKDNDQRTVLLGSHGIHSSKGKAMQPFLDLFDKPPRRLSHETVYTATDNISNSMLPQSGRILLDDWRGVAWRGPLTIMEAYRQ